MTIALIIISIISAGLVVITIRAINALADAKQKANIAEERVELYKQQLLDFKRQTERDSDRFKSLASEIFSTQSENLRKNNELRISEILTPLSENIRDFRKSISESYSAEARERFALDSRIRELIEANRQSSIETRELATALKGSNKAQGDWGEMVLENILEKSGLRKGEEYLIQATGFCDRLTDSQERGRILRPDVLVKYPDGRTLVIDSKVSLKAFLEMTNAETPEERQAASIRHIESVKRHIDELASKEYHRFAGERKTDFVLMFVPNEAAYIAAMQADPNLWERACGKSVLIVSPTLIISALRLIEQLWSRDRQTRNAIEIANAAGKMYDKLAAFVEDMLKVEKTIDSSRSAVAEAMKKLTTGTGNLLSRAEKLRELGAKTSRQMRIEQREED